MERSSSRLINICNAAPNDAHAEDKLRMLKICPNCHKAVPSENSEGVCPACFLMELGVVDGCDGEISRFSLPGVTVREEIARGGVAIAYRGQQLKPQRQLAVKVLQPQWARNK